MSGEALRDTGPSQTGGRPARFRQQAREAAAATSELGPAVERARFSWLARRLESSRGRHRRPRPQALSAPRPGTSGTRTRRFARRPRRPVPVQLQSQVSDCGPASLRMVLLHHGIQVSLGQLREDTGSGRDGVSARSLLAVARKHGLPGRGVRTSLGGLRELPAGSILFWKFNHFVVLEHATRHHVYLVDPAYGRRRLRVQDVGRLFTGVAIEFDPPLPSAVTRAPAEAPRGPWRHLAYFFPRSRKWLPLAAASVAILLFGLLTPLSSAYVVDHRGLGEALGPLQAGLVVVLAAVSFFLLQLLRGTVILELQALAEKRVTLGIFNRLLALPYDFFARRTPGDLALRVRTSTSVRHVLTATVLSAAFDGVLVGFYLAMFLLVDWQVALCVTLLGGCQVGVLLLAWRRQVHLSADELECQAHSNSALNELLEGIGTVKAGGLDETLGSRWAHLLVEEINAGTRRRRHFTLFSALIACVQFSAPLLVLTASAVKVSAGQLTLGEMTALTSLTAGVLIPLTGLVQAAFQLATLKAPLTRLSDILEATPDQPPELTAGAPLPEGAGVEARQVRYQYPGASAPALRGVDLTVPAGGFVAFLGASGCGKSTLAMILAGLYRPTAGEVRIGGRSLADTDRAALRRSLSFVNQDARVFVGSIRENITMGVAADEGGQPPDIVRAARIAHIHDDIVRMPMGYETLLGPGGSGLSGGQRQRIALARALVRRPRILILDEATSALDRGTEERVLAGIRELDCTLLVITHRLSVATRADEICLIGEGTITQRGTHHQLRDVPGPYRDLLAASG